MLWWVAASRASGIEVTTLDEPGVLGDGLCSFTEALHGALNGTDDGWGCAVDFGADTITFGGLSGTITIAADGTGLGAVDGELTIDGPGADRLTIDFDGGRGFETPGRGAQITIRGLTVTGSGAHSGLLVSGGDAVVVEEMVWTGNTSTENGAAIRVSEGASLTATRSAFVGNTCTGTSGYSSGAAIWSEGVLAVRDCAFVGNHSTTDGGAVLVGAGAVATLVNSTFSGNSGWNGGGLAVVNKFGHPTGPSALVVQCTFAENTASGVGGGLSLEGTSGEGGLIVRGSVVARNTAAGGGPDCDNAYGGSATITSLGYNLLGIGDGCGSTVPAEGDRVGTLVAPLDAGLGPLLGAGSHPPVAGSPLIDAIPAAACLDDAGKPLLADQRGAPRPADGHVGVADACDIGAHEIGCGDGQVDAGEECDDGNADEDDGCLATCVIGDVPDTGTGPGPTDGSSPDTADTGETGGDARRCGCAGTPAAGGALVLLVAGSAARRRRR